MEITLNELAQLLKSESKKEFFKIGEKYMVRTVTMIYTGILKDYSSEFLVLSSCHWIAETARWNEFISKMDTKEHESYGDRDVLISRGSILDLCIVSSLPSGNK